MGNYWSTLPKTSLSTNKYGWKPDLPDHRDLVIQFSTTNENASQVDLRAQCPPVYDQGQLGSCTSQALAAAYQFDELKQRTTDAFMPSRLFIYYNERSREHQTSHDSGASIRDGIKVINQLGVCHEQLWPYQIEKFAVKPPSNCYDDAKTHLSLTYRRVKQTKNQLKAALQEGYPIVCGISLFKSFESPEVTSTGQVSLPQPDESLVGGHCILIVGYNDETNQWIFRNSWGTNWGDQGYGYLPYKYLALKSKLATDFWIVETVSQPTTDNQLTSDIEELD